MKRRLPYIFVLLVAVSLFIWGVNYVSFTRENTFLEGDGLVVYDVRINGLENPVGYDLFAPTVSWKAKSSKSKEAVFARVDIYKKGEAGKPIFSKELRGNINKIPIDYDKELSGVLEPRSQYCYTVTLKDEKGFSAVSEECYFETGKLDEPWSGVWVGQESGDTYAPLFRRTFTNRRPVERARLYISGLGLYEASINGQKVGEEVLTPYFSDYDSAVEYQSYDITPLLQGENTLEVLLGDGWYKGRFGVSGQSERYGDKYALKCEIHIDYKNGQSEVVSSDEGFTYERSQIEQNGIYDGETLDMTIEPGEPVQAVAMPELEESLTLCERRSIPVIEMDEIAPQELILTPAGEYVLDFGQNMAGYVEFSNNLGYGQEILLSYGEILQEGNFYNDNLRSASGEYRLKSNGTPGRVKPHFTYYGFRYVKVDGVGEPNPDDFTAKVVYSDMEGIGSIWTGNEKVNKLFENAFWSQKSNFVNIPTDCPQRDERLPWTGDAQVFAPTACFNMETQGFYSNFLGILRDEQEKMDGVIPVVVPNDFPYETQCSSGWSDAAVIIPMTLYEFYGDKQMLRYYYPMMRDWVSWVEARDNERGARYLWDFGFHFGDWLALNGRTERSTLGGTDERFIASCYWCHSSELLSEAAATLGYDADARHYKDLSNKIKEAIFSEYFTETGRLAIDTQAAYLIALDFGIYKDKEAITDALKHRLYMDLYKIDCGYLGAPKMLRILSDNGMDEEAMHLLLDEEYPGWLYAVDLGATTIWERWNSVLPDGTITGTEMNSLNHYAYGSVVEYLYENVGGLKPTEPGFRKVSIKPYITPKLGVCDLTYKSAAGDYRVRWEVLENGAVAVDLEIPFGCEASVELTNYPGERTLTFRSGTYRFKYNPTANLTVPFSKNSVLGDYAGDEGFIEAIGEASPKIAELLSQRDPEIMGETLETLEAQPMLKYSSEELQAVYVAAVGYFKGTGLEEMP